MKDLFGYNLYGGEPPSVSHSKTSKAAANQIKKRIGPLHLKIIQYLMDCPDGATDEKMQIEIPMGANTQRPRRRELELLGRIKDSGKRELTRSKREAVIWILSQR